jgi:tetratricopeptide (TPR) repeat protein
VATDRETTIRRAERLLKQGKLDAAIAEYVQAVEEQPRDWNTANILGDLYARVGRVESAVSQYARVAAHFAQEGFLQKSAALYKKIAKIKPQDEAALLQLADLSEQQGLIADAKACLGSVAEHRRRHGNRKGAAEIVLRLARLDPSDVSASVLAARAAAELGDREDAAARFKAAGHELLRRNREKEGLRALVEAAALDPQDEELQRLLRVRHQRAGQADHAREPWAAAGADTDRAAFDPAPTTVPDAAAPGHVPQAGMDPAGDTAARSSVASSPSASGVATDDTPLGRAERALRTGQREEGRAILDALVTARSVPRDRLVSLGFALADVDPDSAFVCAEVVSDAAVADEGFEAAAAILDAFVRRVPDHVAALMKLIEVAVDGGLDATMYAAQARLADAYLAADRPADARVIAEDLLAREPQQQAHVDRLRRALVALGEEEPDRTIADYLSGASPLALAALWEESGGHPLDEPPPSSPAEPPPGPAAVSPDDVEIELDFHESAETPVLDDAVSGVEEVFNSWLDAQLPSPLLDRPFEELIASSSEAASAEPSAELEAGPAAESEAERETESEAERATALEAERSAEPAAEPEPVLEPLLVADALAGVEMALASEAALSEPAAELEAEPEAQAEPEPEAELVAEPEPELVAVLQAEVEPVLEPLLAADALAGVEMALASEAALSEPAAELEAEPEAQAEPEPAAEPWAEPEAGPEPVLEPLLAADALAGVEMALASEAALSEPAAELEAEPEAQVEPEPAAEPWAEPQFELAVEFEAGPEPVLEPLLAADVLADNEMPAVSEAALPEPEAELVAERELELAAELEAGSEPAFEPHGPIAERPPVGASGAIEEPPAPAAHPDDLDLVFEMFRDEAALRGLADMGAQHLKLAAAYRDIGMTDECLRALEVAAHSPRHRFEAASLLAETLRELGRTREAVEWFERAAEAPAPGVEAGRRLLYELGKTLTDVGESERALAVFLELQADAPDYRDLAVRVRRLSSAT